MVSDGEPAAREHLADHAAGGGGSLIAALDDSVIGIAIIRGNRISRDSGTAASPWVHEIRRCRAIPPRGVATLLMNGSENLPATGAP